MRVIYIIAFMMITPIALLPIWMVAKVYEADATLMIPIWVTWLGMVSITLSLLNPNFLKGGALKIPLISLCCSGLVAVVLLVLIVLGCFLSIQEIVRNFDSSVVRAFLEILFLLDGFIFCFLTYRDGLNSESSE